MSEQLSFLETKPRPTDRLFFAIFPDPDTAGRVAGLAQRLRTDHGLKGHPLALERLHVTLNHLGDHDGLPPGLVARAQEAGAALSEASFEVAFDFVASFSRGRKRPLVLRGSKGVAAVTAFQQALGLAMRKAGLGRWVETQFTPHMTLLYDDRLVGEQIVEMVSWTVREFVLVHSLLGRTQHIPLARWKLRDE